MIKVLYFARLGEQLGTREESLDADTLSSVDQLVAELKSRGEPWEGALETGRVLVAVNQEMTDFNSKLCDGDEVAFFPPVTGG